MAKFIAGALVSQIRNKLGGVVFTQSRYGATIRRRVKPTNPRTTAQVTVRGNFSSASKGWNALTSTQMATYISWAASNAFTDKFGGTHNLAANAAYVRYTRQRYTVGLSATTAPPGAIGAYPPAPTAAAAVSSSGIVTLTTPAQSATSGWYLIRTTAGQKTGVFFAGSKLRIAGVVAAGAAATTAPATPGTYNSKLAFTSGSIVLVSCTLVDVNGLHVSTSSFRVVAS
jgi:hypothetical protein